MNLLALALTLNLLAAHAIVFISVFIYKYMDYKTGYGISKSEAWNRALRYAGKVVGIVFMFVALAAIIVVPWILVGTVGGGE